MAARTGIRILLTCSYFSLFFSFQVSLKSQPISHAFSRNLGIKSHAPTPNLSEESKNMDDGLPNFTTAPSPSALTTALEPVVNGESLVDQRLRQFFSAGDPFTVSRNLVHAFMANNAAIQSSSKPLLSKCSSARSRDGKECGEDYDHEMEDYYRIFSKIYGQIPKKDVSRDDEKLQELKQSQGQNHEMIRKPKRKGRSFKVQVAYRGEDFCGWQIQPNNPVPSVQQTLIDRLDELLNHHHSDDGTQSKKKSRKPIDIRVCGRTDCGVSALGQYCRVRTLKPAHEVGEDSIRNAIDLAHASNQNENETVSPPPSLLAVDVVEVSDKFHPTFNAKCRGYLFLIDADPLRSLVNEFQENNIQMNISIESIVLALDTMLRKLEGKELDYFALSFGKVKTSTTLCTLSRSRAALVESRDGQKAVGIELVGDRFLRRMVRILVATAVREVMNANFCISGKDGIFLVEDCEYRLLSLIERKDRKLTAKAASSKGLIFVGAQFSEDCDIN